MSRTWIVAIGVVVVASTLGLQAQWLRYPTAGVPRLPNGEPNHSAPAPKTADGIPDLSGVWLADAEAGTGVSFTGAPLPPLFRDIRRPSYGNLEIEVTVDDPKAYTAPWTVTINQHLLVDTDLLEFICLENQKFQPLPRE